MIKPTEDWSSQRTIERSNKYGIIEVAAVKEYAVESKLT